MTNYEHVFFGKIDLKLSGFLHIGGEEKQFFDMVTNGDGQFILPGSSIAGAVRAYLKSLGLPVETYMGGRASEAESRMYFYDAVCKEAVIEKRSGVKRDEQYGGQDGGKRYSDFYIGQGMTAEVWVQAFASTREECQELAELFQCMQWGIHSKELTLGARRINGAGVFQVQTAGYLVLSLTKTTDFEEYLRGVEHVFSKIDMKVFDAKSCLEQCNRDMSPKTMTHRVEFELLTEIPDGILVKSDTDSVTEEGSKGNVNVRKLMDGEMCYYIPGSTIRGVICGYAQEVCRYFQIPDDVRQQMFGERAKKYKSHLKTQDVVIEQSQATVYNRMKMDRWIGGIMMRKPMKQEVISTQTGTVISIKVATDMSDSKLHAVLNGLVFLALRDMGLGLVCVGRGSGIGFGRLKGCALKVNGSLVRFEEKKLVFAQGDEGENIEKKIQSWLWEVAHYAV